MGGYHPGFGPGNWGANRRIPANVAQALVSRIAPYEAAEEREMIRMGYTPALGAIVLLSILAGACSSSESFQGTELDPGNVAPLFKLTDQSSDWVGLSDFSGKVVVLAFVYTNCPDVCPITTETLRRAYVLLGEDTEQVEFLAITVDPDRDSVESAYEYSKEKDMLGKWHFLVGSEDELEPIWTAYWLDPVRSNGARHADAKVSDGGGKLGADAALDVPGAHTDRAGTDGYLVSHSAPVFLIDREGYRRVLFTDLSLDPSPLVLDILLLLK